MVGVWVMTSQPDTNCTCLPRRLQSVLGDTQKVTLNSHVGIPEKKALRVCSTTVTFGNILILSPGIEIGESFSQLFFITDKLRKNILSMSFRRLHTQNKRIQSISLFRDII